MQDTFNWSLIDWREVAFAAPAPILMTDLELRITQANPACSHLFAVQLPDLIGARLVDVTMSALNEPGSTLLADLRTGRVNLLTVEATGIDIDGRRWVGDLTASLVHGSAGRPEAIAIAVIDATARKKAEAAISEGGSRFRRTFEQAPVAMVLASPAGRFVKVNELFCELTGFSADELIDRLISDVTHPDDIEHSIELTKRLFAGDYPVVRTEKRYTRSDGTTVWTDLTATLIRDFANDEVLALGMIVDISSRKMAEGFAAALSQSLSALAAGNSALTDGSDERELLAKMCQIIVEEGGYLKSMAMLVDPLSSSAATISASHVSKAAASRTVDVATRAIGDEVIQQVLRSGNAFEVSSVPADADRANKGSRGAVSILALPIKLDNATLGVLVVVDERPRPFNEQAMVMLRQLATDLAYSTAYRRAEARQVKTSEQLQRSLEDTVRAMARALEVRDPYTSGHQQRVTDLAVAIADEMALPDDDVQAVKYAAMVHDLGKIGVPVEILTIPRPLSDAERILVRAHAQLGHDILMGVNFPWPLQEIVLQHHERLDGSGYPRGLIGDEILIHARIIAVADVVESMATHRPYRPSRGIDAALAELADGRGTRYDAVVVDTCVRLFTEEHYELPALATLPAFADYRD